MTFSIGRDLLAPDSKNMTSRQKGIRHRPRLPHNSSIQTTETTRLTILCLAPWLGYSQPFFVSPRSVDWVLEAVLSYVICVFIGISLAYRFQLRILADKARWWQIQEILLTLSVTNVKKAGREDYHTSVQHGLKPDLCCVCVCATSHEISTSIPLYQH